MVCGMPHLLLQREVKGHQYIRQRDVSSRQVSIRAPKTSTQDMVFALRHMLPIYSECTWQTLNPLTSKALCVANWIRISSRQLRSVLMRASALPM
jgi:hypothetical protein